MDYIKSLERDLENLKDMAAFRKLSPEVLSYVLEEIRNTRYAIAELKKYRDSKKKS